MLRSLTGGIAFCLSARDIVFVRRTGLVLAGSSSMERPAAAGHGFTVTDMSPGTYRGGRHRPLVATGGARLMGAHGLGIQSWGTFTICMRSMVEGARTAMVACTIILCCATIGPSGEAARVGQDSVSLDTRRT
jgi:hypothetical protein